MSQATLFSTTQLRKLQSKPAREKKPPRTWQLWDYFPFGRWKGIKIEVVVETHPELLTWWQQTKKVQFSEELQQAITHSKYLAR